MKDINNLNLNHMGRRRNSNSNSRGGGGNNTSLKWLMLLAFIAIIGLVAWLVATLLSNDDYAFKRADLDKYVEMTHQKNLLDDGASVYFDMSDGMIDAYKSDGSKQTLQSVINKLAANSAIEFFGLANGEITSLDKSHTELYNYMLNKKSYAQHQAPIENTLKTIVEKRQPALLMTDFEEYHSGSIQRAAYAKSSFIDWLNMGYNITFYKWSFVERGKNKIMFLAVFDDNMNRLNSLIKEAVETNPSIETFVLGSRNYGYPTMTKYISFKQGGNYHNSKGNDVVTAVLEAGGTSDYICYAKTFATAEGKAGLFAPLNNLAGPFAEYYPIGVEWQSAIANSKMMQETGVPEADMFNHLLSNLYINFKAQDGYDIEKIEIRTFDMQETMKVIASNDTISSGELDAISKPEINEIFVADMEDSDELAGWKHVFVDFHTKFDGTFIGGKNSSNLLRANIVISEVSANIDKAMSFFEWDGNPSLANSVKETLQASISKPNGRILYTYYIKTLSN